MFPCRPKRPCTELGRTTRAKRRNKNTEEREGAEFTKKPIRDPRGNRKRCECN